MLGRFKGQSLKNGAVPRPTQEKERAGVASDISPEAQQRQDSR